MPNSSATVSSHSGSVVGVQMLGFWFGKFKKISMRLGCDLVMFTLRRIRRKNNMVNEMQIHWHDKFVYYMLCTNDNGSLCNALKGWFSQKVTTMRKFGMHKMYCTLAAVFKDC